MKTVNYQKVKLVSGLFIFNHTVFLFSLSQYSITAVESQKQTFAADHSQS